MNGITYPSEVLTWRRYNNGSLLGASVMSSSGGAVDSSITGWNPPNLGYGGVKMYQRVLNVDGGGAIGTFNINDIQDVNGNNIYTNAMFDPIDVVVLESLNGPANGSITHSFSGKATTYGSKGVYKVYAYNNDVWFQHTTSSSDIAGTDSNGVTWAGDSANNVDWLNGATASDMYDYYPQVAFKLYKAGSSELKGYVAGLNLTGLSNQTFLDNAVNGIKDSSPLAFDMLGEIANAVPSDSDASAFINLNTSTRMHTFTGDGSTTEFAVSHKSGNIDVFLDGVLQIPQLSDSASGATTLISSHEYFSNDGSTESVTQYAVDHTQESAIASGTELVRWIGNWGGEWGVRNYYNKTVVLMNGSRITTAGVTLDPSYNDPIYGPWFGFTANTGWPASGFYRQAWGANITGGYTTDSVEYAYQMSTTSVNVPSKIETSGTACSSVVFVDAPQSGQIVTVKTY